MLRYHLMGLMLFNASFGAALALAVASPADVGQTGGAVTGFLLAATLPTIVDDKSNKRMRWIFFGLAGLINIAAIIVVLCVVGRHYI
jgi:biotin transporter BioY